MDRPFRIGWLADIAVLALVGTCSLTAGQALDRGGRGVIVSGVVRNAATSEPLANATVSVRPKGAKSGGPVGTATGMDGRFSIGGLAAGPYVVLVEHRGFVARTFGGGVAPSDSLVVDGDTDVTLSLIPYGVIAGRITEADGSAMSGATIQLLASRVANGRLTNATVAQTSSNDLGEYRIFDIPPGRYYVEAFYRDAASILGLHRRTDSKGDPEDGVFEDYATTYYPGALDARYATPLKVPAGKTLSGIDITPEMIRSVLIEGRVDNMPVGGEGRVFLEPADFRALGPHQVFPVERDRPEFRFKSVPPGDYIIRVQMIPGGSQLAALRHLSVAGAPVRGIVLSLEPNPSVSGNLRVDTGTVPAGAEIALISVGQPTHFDAKVQGDGRFAVPSIPPGTYRAEVVGGSILVKSLSVDGQKLPSDAFEVDHPIDSLIVAATSMAGRLAGAVYNSQGQTLSRGLVVAISSGDQSVHTAKVSEDGTFDVGLLLPGEYRVACFSDLESEQDLAPSILVKISATGEVVSIAEREAKSIRLAPITSDEN